MLSGKSMSYSLVAFANIKLVLELLTVMKITTEGKPDLVWIDLLMINQKVYKQKRSMLDNMYPLLVIIKLNELRKNLLNFFK